MKESCILDFQNFAEIPEADEVSDISSFVLVCQNDLQTGLLKKGG